MRPESTRVLVVDDDPIARMMLAARLSGPGVRVIEADGAEEALLLWDVGGFAAVFTDCRMKPMDGLTLASEIRRRETRRGRGACQIWGCSATVTPDVLDACRSAGMQGCYAKPLSMDLLTEILSTLGDSDPVAERKELAVDRAAAIDTWFKLTTGELSTARDQLGRLDRDALADTLHHIRGGALILGLTDLAHRCAVAEGAARSETAHVHQIEETLESLSQAILSSSDGDS